MKESNNPGISLENRTSPKQAARNPAQLPTAPVEIALDPDLARVVAAWPTLPDAIRRALLALVGSVTSEPRT